MKVANLYAKDETAWLDRTSELIRHKRFKEIDRAHLAQFLRSQVSRDRREVVGRLVTLMAWLLKTEFQSWLRWSSGWKVNMLIHRSELRELLRSKTLKAYADRMIGKAYARAVEQAASETAVDESRFPPSCPYTIDGLIESR